jgi:hypothetical protein
MLSARNWRTEGTHGSGIYRTGNKGRDFKIESGIAFARRREDQDQAGIEAEDVSSRQEKNRSRTTGQVEESQGSNEVTPSLFPD